MTSQFHNESTFWLRSELSRTIAKSGAGDDRAPSGFDTKPFPIDFHIKMIHLNSETWQLSKHRVDIFNGKLPPRCYTAIAHLCAKHVCIL